MNEVYEVELPKSDFEAGMVESAGYLTMPSFTCPDCGCTGRRIPVWYASLVATTANAKSLLEQALPDVVETPSEYFAIRERVRRAFQTEAKLLPGSVVGMLPIAVSARSTISGLTEMKLRSQIDFIWASVLNLVVSPKVLNLFGKLKLSIPTGNVLFRAGEQDIIGYKVLELEPKPAWTQDERKKYKVMLCPTCGSSLKAGGGTFRPKQFDGHLFRDGYAIVRGVEANGIYINCALREHLESAGLSGASFRLAGQWV